MPDIFVCFCYNPVIGKLSIRVFAMERIPKFLYRISKKRLQADPIYGFWDRSVGNVQKGGHNVPKLGNRVADTARLCFDVGKSAAGD